jgi:UrcA family protein
MTTPIIKKVWLEFAFTAALVACSAQALADPAARPRPLDRAPPETRSARVSLADLDLSTPDGARAARDRLHQTARRWCSQLEDSLDLSHQSNFVACMDDALAGALRQLNGPALASRAKEKPGGSQSHP